MKRIVALLLCAATLIGLCSCGSVADVDVELSQPIETTETQSETTQYQETEPLVTSAFISSECDIVLASGYDENSVMYELVANEYEDYTGTTIEVGVIKDNKWFVEPTSDSPFVENGGMFYNRKTVSDIEREKKGWNYPFKYIGNGCFAYGSQILYNSTNGKTLNLQQEIDFYCFAQLDYGSHSYINDRDNIVLATDRQDNIYIINTLTMEYRVADYEFSTVYAYGDGIFMASKDTWTFDYKFYNLEGEELFALSDYGSFVSDMTSTKYDTNPVFSEGKCTFYTQNDQDSVYKITIDKQGNVLESEKVK